MVDIARLVGGEHDRAHTRDRDGVAGNRGGTGKHGDRDRQARAGLRRCDGERRHAERLGCNGRERRDRLLGRIDREAGGDFRRDIVVRITRLVGGEHDRADTVDGNLGAGNGRGSRLDAEGDDEAGACLGHDDGEGRFAIILRRDRGEGGDGLRSFID